MDQWKEAFIIPKSYKIAEEPATYHPNFQLLKVH